MEQAAEGFGSAWAAADYKNAAMKLRARVARAEGACRWELRSLSQSLMAWWDACEPMYGELARLGALDGFSKSAGPAEILAFLRRADARADSKARLLALLDGYAGEAPGQAEYGQWQKGAGGEDGFEPPQDARFALDKFGFCCARAMPLLWEADWVYRREGDLAALGLWGGKAQRQALLDACGLAEFIARAAAPLKALDEAKAMDLCSGQGDEGSGKRL